MKFKRASKHHKVSDCGKYTVAVVFVGDCKLYESYCGKKYLARFDNLPDAESACKKHFNPGPRNA